MFENRLDLSDIHQKIEAVKSEIKKIIVGQDNMIELLIAAILSRGHVLIEGYPGVAKTLTAKLLARTISTDFSRIQFTPDLMPSDVLGSTIYNFKTSSFDFKKGPIFSNIILIDEINRAPAKTQSALFEVMEERQVTIDGTTYTMNDPFLIVATQNPIDLEGTYRLPEAQMDRFIFKINVDYPNLAEEVEIITGYHEMKNKNDLDRIVAQLSEADIARDQDLVKSVHVEEKLIHFIAQIVQKTRMYKDIQIGASPRASLAILSGSKAIAVIRGRDFVTPEDILQIVKPVLIHRISLTPEKEMEGTSGKAVIDLMLKGIEVPR
jgi:MoxR-like ATPase